MQRLGVHQLEASGVRDGTKYLRDDGAWATPAGGGGGGSGSDRRWTPGVDEITIDEFANDNLDATWIRVDKAGGTGRATWNESADTLGALNAGGDASQELHALMRPLATSLSVGDGFVTCLTFTSEYLNYAMAGICLADGTTHGAGGQVISMSFRGNRGDMANSARSYTGYNTHVATSTDVYGGYPGPLFVRLALVAANTWRVDVSPNGHTWLIGSTLARTLTPTHVGLYCTSYGSATKSVTSFEFLRRVAGVT